MNLAIIPARSGSKRIKNKNIINFHGKPIIFYSINTAIKSKLFDKIIVSTDSTKISKIGKENKTNDKELCPIYLGVAFLDHCLELEKLKTLKFYNVSYPLLMLPFISRASEIMSKKILVQFDNSSFLLNFDKSIFSKNIEKQSQSITKLVNIEFMENKNSFSKQDWKELYKLSEETFVDESDSLKKTGAGAGLTDND